MGLLQGYKQFTELLGRFKTEPQRIACRAQRLMRNYRIDQLLMPKPRVPVTTRSPLWSGSPRSKTDIFRSCLPAGSAETPECQPLLLVVDVQLLSHVRLFVTPWTAAWSLLCLPLLPRVCSNSCLLDQSRYPILSSSAAFFFFCSPSLLAFGCFLMSQLLYQVPKVLELHLQHQSFQWTFKTDFL